FDRIDFLLLLAPAAIPRVARARLTLAGFIWSNESALQKTGTVFRISEHRERDHAARKRPNPLARADGHAQGRIRRVHETAPPLRRLHGVRGHPGVPRHRHTQSAGPAARALDAHRRPPPLYP